MKKNLKDKVVKWKEIYDILFKRDNYFLIGFDFAKKNKLHSNTATYQFQSNRPVDGKLVKSTAEEITWLVEDMMQDGRN